MLSMRFKNDRLMLYKKHHCDDIYCVVIFHPWASAVGNRRSCLSVCLLVEQSQLTTTNRADEEIWIRTFHATCRTFCQLQSDISDTFAVTT